MKLATCASDLAKKVSVLDARMWLKTAWDNVKPTTIQKCVAKCGFTKAAIADPTDTDTIIDSNLSDFMETSGVQILLRTQLQTSYKQDK